MLGVIMGYTICKIQNNYKDEDVTISISETDEGWEEALKNWKKGKPPTKSKEWKNGTIVAKTKLKEEK
jgi:hypothetical protein